MTATTPLTYGKSVDFFVQMTQSDPRATMVIPIIPPTQECVVETGISKAEATTSQMETAKITQRQPYIKRPGSPIVDMGGFVGSVTKLPSKHFWLAIPLRIVFTTWPPMNMAPVNSKTAASMTACLMERAPEPTEVAKAFATSLAPVDSKVRQSSVHSS